MTVKRALLLARLALGIEVLVLVEALVLVAGGLVCIWLDTGIGFKVVASGMILMFPTLFLLMALLAENGNT